MSCLLQALGLECVGLRLWDDVVVTHAERRSLASGHHVWPAGQYGGQVTVQCHRWYRLP